LRRWRNKLTEGRAGFSLSATFGFEPFFILPLKREGNKFESSRNYEAGKEELKIGAEMI